MKTLSKEKIELMLKLAKQRNAPVLTIKNLTKNNRFKVLVFAFLSTRTKDEKTIEATRKLFSIIKGPKDLDNISVEQLEKILYGVGFYKTKAKRLKELAKTLCLKYACKVPESFEQLITMPGIGRKVANVYLADALNKDVIAVDVHVHRISNRLGLVQTKTPEQTEQELKKIVKKKLWNRVNIAMVAYGQTICKPIGPLCKECPLKRSCKYYKDHFSK